MLSIVKAYSKHNRYRYTENDYYPLAELIQCKFNFPNGSVI